MTTVTASPGLSTTEIDEIRKVLANGRQPKVMFTAHAGQIAGQVGQVVKLTDPAASDEWLVVRFGHDELSFSPTDLMIPPRGRSRSAEAKAASGKPASEPPAPATGGGASAPAASGPDRAPRKTTAPAAKSTATAKADSATGAGQESTSTRAQPAKPARRGSGARGAARTKTGPTLTVTLTYETGEWMVAAQQGSRTLAKPYLIRPSEALQLVALLDVPGVQEAVEQIVNAELAEAHQRAETLRNELAEVEARLAELRAAG